MALSVVFEKNVPAIMRDGTTLRANVFRPNAPGKFPGILVRTPYGKPESGLERFALAGYAVAVQDLRGRYASEGNFVPFHVEKTGDAEDGYDSVEWLAAQPYCNGKVGTMGASYAAWTQWMLAKLRPPHLVAMCAYSIPVELTDLDWPGAFRPGRRVHWWMNAIAPDLRRRGDGRGPKDPGHAREVWREIERASWIHFLPWTDLPKHLPKGLAECVADWLKHPNRRAWRFDEAHLEIEVPNLDFSGWYDHCGGTIRHLAGMQARARTELARKQSKLVIGPWNHVGPGLRKTSGHDFGAAAEMDVHGMIIRWFDRWLKQEQNGVDREPAVRYFVIGSGRWKSAGNWPPEGARRMEYYLESEGDAGLSGSGRLQNDQPSGHHTDEYDYDPMNPVPTLWTPELFTGPSDRRVLEYRSDILYYRTDRLSKSLEIAGDPELTLYASSTARDTDFFARLVDEDPSGPALEISYGMVRARHRNSICTEELLEPGKVEEFHIKLGPTACRFRRGHRVRLEITSSDFPNFDRNHNTGGNDLAEVKMISARQSVHHSRKFPSHLALPCVS